MKVLFIEAGKNRFRSMDIEDELSEFYELIGCNCIDIAVRKVKGKPFDFIVDDEGLLKTDVKFATANRSLTEAFAGNVIVCGTADAEGRQTSLTDEDVRLLLSNRAMIVQGTSHYEILLMDEVR